MTKIKLPTRKDSVNISNCTFNRLFVISYSGCGKWLCKCDCGNFTILKRIKIITGHTKSCGCLKKEKSIKQLRIKPEYRNWHNMKNRCVNPNVPEYKNYGEKGVTVCDRWLDSFENFLEDMGERPTLKHSIDRIDNNKGYSPENCRWATAKEQSRNNRRNIWFDYLGRKILLVDLAEKTGVNQSVIMRRLRKGLSFEDAIKPNK